MSTTTLRPLLLAAALAGSAALALPTAADAATRTVTTASLVTIEDVRAAGLVADTAALDRTGDAQLNDAGHFDESCLHDKTIRAITGAKSSPAPGTGRGYADGTFTSTLDKEVWVTESVAQGRTNADTDRYVGTLTDEIVGVQDCQEDPAQGFHYTAATRVRAGGGATADYYSTVYPDGSRDGGGVAVVRDGTRFGIVSVGSGHDRTPATLRSLATRAADRLR